MRFMDMYLVKNLFLLQDMFSKKSEVKKVEEL